MPPKIHTKKTISVDPTLRTTLVGTRKIPLPITVPMTTAMADQKPKARRNSGCFSRSIPLLATYVDYQRNQQSRAERRHRADQNVPRPRDRGFEFNVEYQAQSYAHRDHRRDFPYPLRQQSQQKDAQQGAINYRCNRQSGFEHAAPIVRQHPDAKQNQRPDGRYAARNPQPIRVAARFRSRQRL